MLVRIVQEKTDKQGSSTELAPSLLGIYDTLTSTLTGNYTSNNSNSSSQGIQNKESVIQSSISNNSSRQSSFINDEPKTDWHKENHDEVEPADIHDEPKQLQPVTTRSATVCTSVLKSTYGNSDCVRSLRDSRESFAAKSVSKSTSSLNINRHRNNIRVLSPNVQRIITHSDAVPVDTVDIDALQQQVTQTAALLKSSEQSPLLHQRYMKKSTPATAITTSRAKLSHIPLLKITGKLTQSGNELVQTFDSSTEYLNSLNLTQTDRTLRKSSPPTPGVVHIPGVDDDKTPTNKVVSPFNFECALNKTRKLTLPKYEAQESIKLIEMEQLAATKTTQLLNGTADTNTLTNNANSDRNDFAVPTRPKEFVVATEPLSPVEHDKSEIINFDLLTQHIEQLTLSSDFENGFKSMSNSYNSAELIEAINKPLISKPLVRSSSAASPATVNSSATLTYARAKSLAGKANTLGPTTPAKLPTAEELAELEEANKISAESLDRLTDIKSSFSPKEARKMSSLMLPEIAKLKHRPLSSSSICSTSSSSSSGSDQLNGKLATSYLASVESLAESENELSGMSVLERACLEIVDSERSYVEDLGQVIRGYLYDWKERACLRYDELKILFSNIEEIYEFNSTLLKQLINSGMDPFKIAKCFIDLSERFNVYTTYCTSYPEAISLLTKLLQATHTNSLLASTQKMLQHTLPLGSYLLKPVQRILKYHLLLDNLRKHCDVKEVLQAYEIMRQVARNIDQVKRKLEQQSRVKELSGILDGWLGPELTVLGELRQEGLLLEHNKPRLVFLFAAMLIITKQKEDGRLQFKSYIHQNNLMLNEHLPGEPTSFYVIPYDEPRNQIKLTAKNRDQKRLWAKHVKEVILEKFGNIPKRAKELVYQLGDEEDRTPDRSTWKWSLHSNSSTPVYLERRNQCRRSEIRNRSKFKRKTVTNSSSFDSFNETVEQMAKEQQLCSAKPLARINSMDDNMLPALQRIAAAVRSRSSKRESVNGSAVNVNANSNTIAEQVAAETKDCKCAAGEQHCLCILREKSASSNCKSPIFSYKALKERSKSVPRIAYATDVLGEEDVDVRGSKTNVSEHKSKGKAVMEVKQYNHKTMPKRIATLKKQRHSKKETCKFYMDLSEFESSSTTVLKITESTENLSDEQPNKEKESKSEVQERNQLPDIVEQYCAPKTEQEQQEYEAMSPAERKQRDAQIILDLLKDHKEFDRIYNKQQKRREHNLTSPLNSKSPTQEELPPRPPSRSPPPLDLELEERSVEVAEEALAEEEPIYETLLRNVHVPYKFSPVMSRAKSTQCYRSREQMSHTATPRPESDYVTLVYSSNGVLQKVGEEFVPHEQQYAVVDDIRRDSCDSTSSSSSATIKRESQNTVINLDFNSQNISPQCTSSGNTSTSTTEPLYARPIPKNLMKRLLSSSSNSSKTSLESVSNSETSLLPRALKSIDNISLVFGRTNRPPERRVSDVTEMCRKSILHRQGSEAVGERMAHVDYADPRTLFNVMANSDVSLQRDSVFSLTSSNDSFCEQQRKRSATELPKNFEYEQNVEECLENDFRDSAIYSDDNEKRAESDLKCPNTPPPPLPPARNVTQVPTKSATLPAKELKITARAAVLQNLTPNVIVCPPHMSESASRSWVLQQIENFSK